MSTKLHAILRVKEESTTERDKLGTNFSFTCNVCMYACMLLYVESIISLS